MSYIFDASQFPDDHPDLTLAGIPRFRGIYMQEFFPDGEPWDKVYRDHVVALGRQHRLAGYINMFFNLEYIKSSLATVGWGFRSEETRPGAIQMWIELIDAYLEGYGSGCTIAMYGNHPDWTDYFQFLDERGPDSPATKKKYDFFQKWEEDIAPLIDALGQAAPSVYGAFAKYSDGSLYGGRVDYPTYFRWWDECNQQIAMKINEVHGPEIVTGFFHTDNLRGVMYPPEVFRETLGKLSEVAEIIYMWNAPAYMPQWDRQTVGQLIYHHGI